MGSLRLTLCAGSVVAAALTPAPYAYAADAGISVTPSPPVPGNDIQLRVQGCTGPTGTAKSEAFVADAQLVGKTDGLVGETRVRSTLTPGTYDVRVTCDGFDDKVKGTLSVVDKKQQEKEKKDKKGKQGERGKDERGEREKEGASTAMPAAPASPVAPVRAGGGGTARLAAVEARSEGPGTPHAVIGLVLAGAAAVAVAVRSARRGRGSGSSTE
jgi:hypothetical protein